MFSMLSFKYERRITADKSETKGFPKLPKATSFIYSGPPKWNNLSLNDIIIFQYILVCLACSWKNRTGFDIREEIVIQ